MRVETVYTDSVSIRAIEFLDKNNLAFAGSNGFYGTVELGTHKVRTQQMKHDLVYPEFRAVAHTANDFFMLSVANPALLYKTGNNGNMELVYTETGENVFYDAMDFWNDLEGLAIGDSMNGCLSIIITRDGGNTWNKLPCHELPPPNEGEGAFAASNTNIVIHKNNAFVATTNGSVYVTEDKGKTWTKSNTPIRSELPTEGIYSMDFYDENRGFAIGGDFSAPDDARANKISTVDGGKNWTLIADGIEPGYRSCVQFVPNSGGMHLVAVGFKGIDYSSDFGENWKHLSGEGFYTLRFLNDSVAYAAGKNRIAKLRFN